MPIFAKLGRARASAILGALTLAAAAAVPCHSEGTKPPATGDLYRFDAPGGGIASESGVTTSVVTRKGVAELQMDVKKLDGYPGIDIPVPSGGWDLTGYSGADLEVANQGPDAVTINLKVQNEGDWKQSPWSIDMITLAPGETNTLKVVFGQCFGHPAFQLDLAHINAIRIYIVPTAKPASVVLGPLKAFKGAPPSAADATGDAPEVPEETMAPVPAAIPKAEPEIYRFPQSPLLEIAGKHDFATGVTDEASDQLKGLCSLAEFRAMPEADRHVYSFETWPGDKGTMEGQEFTFNLGLGTQGATNERIAFLPDGFLPPKAHTLTRDKDPVTGQYLVSGFGNLDWGGHAAHVFKFNRPVLAFGVVLRSDSDMELKRFFWASADTINGFPVSYTLADGTVVQLGKREMRGATIKGGTDAFLGVIDHTGCGIVSVTYTLGGLAGNKGQGLSLLSLGFVTPPQPESAPVISLASSRDFADPYTIEAKPTASLEGLASMDAFRFIVANHRYVYDFDTWPQGQPVAGSNRIDFPFDLKGNGKVGQKVTLAVTNKAGDAKPGPMTVKASDGQTCHVLGGLGDIGNGAWTEQTFKFEKPVLSFGAVYGSTGEVRLSGASADYPLSYTLADGTIVNLGHPGVSGGALSAGGRTFVGVIDGTDKGISSVTVRLQGTASGAQPVYLENLAFALSGPPPGDWKLTMDDEFNGDKLDSSHWSTGYTFPDVINNELQAYVPENVVVANGVCTIKVEHRDAVNTDWIGRTGAAQKFASGSFTSYDKFTQTYGYFEARIKMTHPRGAGTWPAFWMLPDRGREFANDRGSYRTANYGMGSEIDIFEFMPWWKRPDGLFPIHVGTIWSYGKETPQDPAPHGYGSYALDNNGWGPDELDYPNADTEFHTYGIYWSKERLIYYLDSKPIFRVKDAKTVPDVPEYFLFNIGLSGNGWGKRWNKKNPTVPQIVHDLPNEMQIDYFRAYSGVLDEGTPALPEDLPVVKKYAPPGKAGAVIAEKAAPAPAPAPAPDSVPAAPVNSTITTPAQ